MKKFSPLLQWMSRGDNLSSLLNPKSANPNLELGGFLALDKAIFLHETLSINAESLKESWIKSDQYISDAKETLGIESPEGLDRYEINLIHEELGSPPTIAYPLYLITVSGKKIKERIVYIGKTSSKNQRFKGGHAAITKLHAPEYKNLEKKLYLACIILLTTDKNYLPLDWVSPLSRAEELLNSIEAQLIFNFQPELNTHHKNKDNTKEYIQLHIQNPSNTSGFLDDVFC